MVRRSEKVIGTSRELISMTEEVDYEAKSPEELSDMFEKYNEVLSATSGDSSKASRIWSKIKEYRASTGDDIVSVDDMADDDMEFGDTDDKKRFDKLLSDLGIRVGRHTLVTIFLNGTMSEISDPYYLYTILRMNRVRAEKIATIISYWYSISPLKVRKMMIDFDKRYKKESGPVGTYDDDGGEDVVENEVKYKNPEDIVKSITEEKLRRISEDLELKRKEAELAKLNRIIEGDIGGSGTNNRQLIEVPYTDQNGNPVFDASGNVVMVKVDPNEELKRRQMMALIGQKNNDEKDKDENTLAAILQAMMTQQNQMFALFMEKNKGSEASALEAMREEIRARDERHANEVSQMAQLIAKMRNDEIENKINQLAGAVMNRGNELDETIATVEKLKQLGILNDGKKTPEERALDMQIEAMRNSYEMVRNAQSGIGRELSKVVDLGTGIIRDEYQRDLQSSTEKPQSRYTEEEMERLVEELETEQD